MDHVDAGHSKEMSRRLSAQATQAPTECLAYFMAASSRRGAELRSVRALREHLENVVLGLSLVDSNLDLLDVLAIAIVIENRLELVLVVIIA